MLQSKGGKTKFLYAYAAVAQEALNGDYLLNECSKNQQCRCRALIPRVEKRSGSINLVNDNTFSTQRSGNNRRDYQSGEIISFLGRDSNLSLVHNVAIA